MYFVVVVVLYLEAEIASGKYVLSSRGMIGSRVLRLITQFAVFQGLTDVVLKTCGIGYTLDYNNPTRAVRPMIR